MKNLVKDILHKIHVTYLHAKAVHLHYLFPERQVLIIAPHPDDEVIGCGGLIARLVAEGRTPHIAILTGGEGSHRVCCNTLAKDIIHARRGLTRKALSMLGVPASNIHELEYPDGGIATENNETARLRSLIADLNPDTVFVPHWGEGWPDHINAAKIAKDIAPCGTGIWEYCVWMWYYNVWRGLDWKNAAVLRMTPEEHQLKLAAMEAYINPVAPCGKPWSGVLPGIFIKANQWNRELYFKVR